MCLVLFVVPLLVVSADRVLARLAVGYAVAVAYEAVSGVAFGATPGKQITGIRVALLDRPSVDAQAAIRRAMVTSFMTLTVAGIPLVVAGNTGSGDGARLGVGFLTLLVTAFVGGCAALSALTSPSKRGFADRLAGTAVLDREAPDDFGFVDIAAREARQAPVATNPAGPPASFDRRRRARASRLDDSPILVLLIVALGFAFSVPSPSGWLLGLLALVWEAAFVADETWRISRTGATGGHRRFGLAVVDRRTGEAPSPMQAVTRAVLVSLPLYVLPVLTIVGFALSEHGVALVLLGALSSLLIVVWLVVMRFLPGRSLHDLAARTNVVSVSETGRR